MLEIPRIARWRLVSVVMFAINVPSKPSIITSQARQLKNLLMPYPWIFGEYMSSSELRGAPGLQRPFSCSFLAPLVDLLQMSAAMSLD